MKTFLQTLLLMPLLALAAPAQDDQNWPPLSYLRNDYKAVAVVAHIRIQKAEITSRIPGYESWTIAGEVLEPFKGRLQKGDVIEYHEGVEAGSRRDYTGEKLVFLLAESRREGNAFYSALENSTLPYTEDRARKLRAIKRSFSARRTRKSRNHSSTFATTSAR